MRLCCAVIVASLSVGAARSAPVDVVSAAYTDCLTLDPVERTYVRYLSLDHISDPKARDLWVRVISGHCNGISAGRRIVRPLLLNDGKVLRINLQWYKWDEIKFKSFKNVWEALGEQDQYFHDKARIVVEDVAYETTIHQGHEWIREVGGPWVLKKEWTKGRTWQRKTKKVTTLAPWLLSPQETEMVNAKHMKEEATKIGSLAYMLQTTVPILRADWFFAQTAIQEDREPGYYDFIGIKNQKDFEKLVGFDAKLFRSFFGEFKEAVARSNVNVYKQARRIEVDGSAGGAIWRTKDSRLAKGRNDPLNILDDTLEFDATEQFAPGPNGMMKWFLGNNKGEIQNAAPDFIVSNQRGAAHDSRVHINLTCIECHSNAGVKDFNEWARNLFKPPNRLEAKDEYGKDDYKRLEDLRDWYERRLEPFIDRARTPHALAVFEATGWKAEEYARNYYAAWTEYIEDDITFSVACHELGCTEEKFRTMLLAQRKFLPPVFLFWLREKREQQPISRITWESIYPDAQAILHGLQVTTLKGQEK